MTTSRSRSMAMRPAMRRVTSTMRWACLAACRSEPQMPQANTFTTACPVGGEMRILFLHALEGILDGRVAARQPARQLALLVDPFAHAFAHVLDAALGDRLGRWAQPLDGNQLAHLVGIDAGVSQGDVAAERMRDDGDRRELLLMDEL